MRTYWHLRPESGAASAEATSSHRECDADPCPADFLRIGSGRCADYANLHYVFMSVDQPRRAELLRGIELAKIRRKTQIWEPIPAFYGDLLPNGSKRFPKGLS